MNAQEPIDAARTLMPVIDPETLMDDECSPERCCEVTEEVLRTVCNLLCTQWVMLGIPTRALALSFAHAIRQPASETWRGEEAYVSATQQASLH